MLIVHGDFYPSGNLTLTTIPRGTTISTSVRSKTINSITVNWTTADATDYRGYSLDGGNTWHDAGDSPSMTTNGYYTITNLNYNTTYNIITKVKGTISQVYSTSGTLRASTYDIARITSAPNINIGESHIISWTNPMELPMQLKLCKTDGTLVENFGTVTGNSIQITPTANSIYALIPNANSITLKYVLISTYQNTEYETYKECTFSVINSNPIFNNFDYQDINSNTTALTGNNKIIIKNFSKIKGIISTQNKAVARNSATMQTYKLLIGSQSQTANYKSNENVEITLPNPVDINTIDMYATDSRGNSTKVSKTAQIKNYTPIKIYSVSANRQNNISSTVILNFEVELWNESFGQVTNSVMNCIYKYKKTSDSSYITGITPLTYTISNNRIIGEVEIAGDLGASGFNESYSYNILFSISDKLTTDEMVVTFGSGEPAIAIYRNNIAIGKKYDENLGGTCQLNGDVYLNGTKLLELIFPIGSTYITQTNTNPNTILNFGTWERLKGKVCVGLDENDTDLYFDTIGKTGGEKKHTLTTDEMPAHTHKQYSRNYNVQPTSGGSVGGNLDAIKADDTGSTGGGQPHNIVQPYEVVGYMWIRRS